MDKYNRGLEKKNLLSSQYNGEYQRIGIVTQDFLKNSIEDQDKKLAEKITEERQKILQQVEQKHNQAAVIVEKYFENISFSVKRTLESFKKEFEIIQTKLKRLTFEENIISLSGQILRNIGPATEKDDAISLELCSTAIKKAINVNNEAQNTNLREHLSRIANILKLLESRLNQVEVEIKALSK